MYIGSAYNKTLSSVLKATLLTYRKQKAGKLVHETRTDQLFDLGEDDVTIELIEEVSCTSREALLYVQKHRENNENVVNKTTRHEDSEYQKKQNEMVYCSTCNCEIKRMNQRDHQNTDKHKMNSA